MELTPSIPKDWLQLEFNRRRERNPQYSLRAFSRQIDLPPGRVSEILADKRRLTPALAEKICARLGYPPELKARFLSAVARQRAGGAPVKAGVPEDAESEFHQLSVDAFYVISDWYHFAILSLLEIPEFRNDPRWIARRLGISVNEARGALERLERIELVRPEGKKLVLTRRNLTTTHDVSSAALKKAHRQTLERAITALEEVPVEERDVTAITMAVDRKRLPAAKKMIRQFRRKLCAFLEAGEKDEVFNLNVQLVPVSKRHEGGKR